MSLVNVVVMDKEKRILWRGRGEMSSNLEDSQHDGDAKSSAEQPGEAHWTRQTKVSIVTTKEND